MGKEIACSAKERDVYVRSVKLSFKGNRLAKRIFFEVSGCGGFLNGSERVVTGKIHLDGCEIVFIAEGDAAFIVNLEKFDIVVEPIAGFRRICGVGMGPVEILPKFGRRSTPALFAYSCIKETDLFFAEGARGWNMEKTGAPEQTAKYPSA